MNQYKNDLCFAEILSFGMSLSLIWLISYEFLTGKRGDMCCKIVKEEYLTFARLDITKTRLFKYKENFTSKN